MNEKGLKKGVVFLGIIIALLFVFQPLSTMIFQEERENSTFPSEETGAGARSDIQEETVKEKSQSEEKTEPTAKDEIEDFKDETRSARKYLDVFKLNFNPFEPEDGETVEITADIKNKGREGQVAEDVNVEFWYDEDNFIGSTVIDEIEPGDEVSATIEWKAVVGDHHITVKVDPDGNSGGPDELTKSISVSQAYYSPHLFNAYTYQSIKVGDTIYFYVKLTNKGTRTDSFDITMTKEFDGTSSGWTITKNKNEINDLEPGDSDYITVEVSYDEAHPVYYKEVKVTIEATSRGDTKKKADIELRAAVIHDKPILFVDDDDQQNDVERGHYQVSPEQHGPQTDEFITTLLDYFYPGMWDKVTLPGDYQPYGYMSNQGDSGPPYDSSVGVSPYEDSNGDPIYLKNYDLVIWDTGYSETLTANTESGSADEGLGGPFPDDGSTETHAWYDQQELSKYLDNGGAFWWMNNKGAEWHDRDAGTVSNQFIRNYFHIEKFIQSVGLGNEIVGVGSDPIGRGIKVMNSYIYGFQGDRAEILIPMNDAYGVIYSGNYYSCVRYEYNTANEPTFRTLYQAGNIASYGPWNYYNPMRMKFFKQAVSWLGVPDYMPPEVDVGIKEINSPKGGLVNPDTDIPLNVAVKNFGQKDLTDVTVDFKVEDKDDNYNVVFTDSKTVKVETGETVNVKTTWSEPVYGRHYMITIKVSTAMGDEDATNDKVYINVTASDYKDVGVKSVDYSKTTHYWNTTRVGDETDIWAVIHNYGGEYADFQAELEIKSPYGTRVYIASTEVEGLPPGEDIELRWTWTPHQPAGRITAWHADRRSWEDAYNVTVRVYYSGDGNESNDEGYIGSGNTKGLVAMAYDDTSNPKMMNLGEWKGVDLSGHNPSYPTPIHPAYYHMQSPPAAWTAVVDDDTDDWGYVYPNWKTCVISPKLDLSNFTKVEVNWLMGGHRDRGTFYWEYSTDFDGVYERQHVEDATWSTIYSWSGGSNAWAWYIYSGGNDLTDELAGEESVYLRLRFVSSVSSKERMGVFVDDLALSGVVDEYNFPDLALEKLSVNPSLDDKGVERTIEMTIHNTGQVDAKKQDNIYIELTIEKDGEVLDGFPTTLDVNENIGINERYTDTYTWTPEEEGDYIVTAKVYWEDQFGTYIDSDARNDEKTAYVYAKFRAFYDDVEGAQKFTGGVEDTSLPNTWDMGAPTSGPGFAHSGDNVWATNLHGDYPNYDGGKAYIEREIDLRKVRDPVLSFWHWLEIEGGGFDTARVKVKDLESRGGDWVTIWENPPPEEEGKPYKTDGWEYVERPLVNETLGYNFGYTRIMLRFEIQTDGDTTYEGWYLDDIGIGGSQPPKKDAALNEVIYPPNGGYVYPGAPVTLKIKVSNVGTESNSIPVEVKIYEVFGGEEQYRDTLNVESPSLEGGQWDIVLVDWQVPYADNVDYHLYFETKLNGDANPLNDKYDIYVTALKVHDIGIIDLYAKPTIQDLNNPRTITVQLKNWGNVEENNIKVKLIIRDRTNHYLYTAVKYVDIFPQDTKRVEFKWISIHYEEYYIKVNVTLEGGHDENYLGLHRNELEIGDIRTVERIFYDDCESTPVFKGTEYPTFWEEEGDGFETSANSAGWHNVNRGHQSEKSYYCGIPAQNTYANRMNSQLVSMKMNLEGVSGAKLRFFTKFYVEGRKYDNLYLYFRSKNNNWQEITVYPEYAGENSTYYSTAVNGWLMKEYDIDDKFLEEDFQMKFVFKTDSDVTLEGMYLDDISIFASPTTNHPPYARFSATWSDNTSYSIDLIKYPTPEIEEITQGDLDYMKLPKPEAGRQGGIPLIGEETELVTLNASYSFDPDILDQDALVYEWNFGDGTEIVVTNEPVVSHQFQMTEELETDPISGKKYFNVTLTVRDGNMDPADYPEIMTDYLWIFVGNTPPVPEFHVYSNDVEITETNDNGKDDEYIEVFWGDVLEFSENAYDPEGKLNTDSFKYSFSAKGDGTGDFAIDKEVMAGRLKVVVGGKLLSKDGNSVNYPGTFFNSTGTPPESQDEPYIYKVWFTVRDKGGEEATGYKLFKVYPYARKTYTAEFYGDNNEILKPMVELEWRGFKERAADVESEWHPETKPVFVKIELTDSPTGTTPKGGLGYIYKVTVIGTKLQNGRTGYKSLTMYMPYSYSSLEEIGSAANLRDQVSLYQYSTAVGNTFVEIGGSEPYVLNNIHYAKGTKIYTGRGVSTSDEISLIVAPIVKGVNEGTALPDLTIGKIEFSRTRVIIGTEVEIRAYINNVGVTHAKNFNVRFLDGDITIGSVEVSELKAGEREYLVTMSFNATEVGTTVAEHQITVMVDADRDVTEGTPDSPAEQNNKRTEVFEVIEYAPMVTSSFNIGFLMVLGTASAVASLAIFTTMRRKKKK